jgi:hypothetical protein
MNQGKIILRTALFALVLPLAACATSDPINLSTQFTPPSARWSPMADNSSTAETGVCRIHLTSVSDVRSDTQAMGTMGLRAVRISDSAGWIRSGIQSLSRDPRLQFVDDQPAFSFNIELVKAYAQSRGTERTSTVVLRADYSADDKQVYRGADTSLNWNNTDSETQSGLDSALAQVLEALDRDIVARCKRT